MEVKIANIKIYVSKMLIQQPKKVKIRSLFSYDEKTKKLYKKLYRIELPEYIDYEVNEEPKFYSQLLC